MRYIFLHCIVGLCLLTTTLVAYKEVVVDLSIQRAYAYEYGYLVFEGAISTGKEGFAKKTPP